MDNRQPRTDRWHGDGGRAATDHLACLLVFAIAGLLTDGLALLMQRETSLVSLSLAMIAGAAPMAAMVALRCAGHARRRLSRNALES